MTASLNPTSSDKTTTAPATKNMFPSSLNPTSSDKTADLAYSKCQRATSAFSIVAELPTEGQLQRTDYKLFMKV